MEELAAPQHVHFALKMRNFEELDARIARGEVLSLHEMQSRYFPFPDTWEAVAAWASSPGLIVEPADAAHMTVFATSTVSNVQAALSKSTLCG